MRPIYLMTRKVPNHQSNRQKQKVPGTGVIHRYVSHWYLYVTQDTQSSKTIIKRTTVNSASTFWRTAFCTRQGLARLRSSPNS